MRLRSIRPFVFATALVAGAVPVSRAADVGKSPTLASADVSATAGAHAAPTQSLHRIAVLEDRRDGRNAQLATFLSDEDAAVRRRAVVALGRIQDASAISLLNRMLSDRDRGVRQAAVFALGQVGTSAALVPLLRTTQSDDADLVARALIALGKTTDKTVTKRLVSFLRHMDATLRASAAYGLAYGGDSTAVPALIEALADTSSEVRAHALHALERIGDPRGADGALRLARDPDARVRAFALRALAKLGAALAADPALAEALAPAFADEDWRIRALAARTAGGTKTRLAVAELLRALEDPYANVREAAVAALGELPPLGDGVEERVRTSIAALAQDSLPGIRFRAGSSLAKRTGSAGLDAVLPFVDDVSPVVASKVLSSLGALRDEGFHDLLRRRAGDPDRMVRAGAFEALGAYRDPRDEPLFVRALKDPDWVVATIAAEALGQEGSADAIDPLVKALESRRSAEESEVRATILSTLGLIGGPSEARVVRAGLRDEDERVRRAAAESLTRLTGDSTAAPAPSRATAERYASDFGVPLGELTARIVTDRGEIQIELFGDDAPATVTNFLALARTGYYDGLRFHRVVPNFVIQSGCPRGDGWGSAGYTIRCEIGEAHYATGAVGMAHAGKDTGGSQFFITHSPQPHLEGRYTLFGRVVSGQDVADRITEGDRILRVDVPDPSSTGSERLGMIGAEGNDG